MVVFEGYIFNVGQANFSLVTSGSDAIVLDCGASQGNPVISSHYRLKGTFNSEDGNGITAFRNILSEEGIRNANIVISHQDADHANLLEDVAHTINSTGAIIGTVYVGGEPQNEQLKAIIEKTFKQPKRHNGVVCSQLLSDPRIPAKIRYISHIQDTMGEETFGVPYRINPYSSKVKPIADISSGIAYISPATCIPTGEFSNWRGSTEETGKIKRSIKIPFGDSKARILLPTHGYGFSDPNSNSLVTLVEDNDKKALFPGDVTERVLDDIIETHPNAMQNISVILSPHHSTAAHNSAYLVQKIAALNTTGQHPLVLSSDGFGIEHTNSEKDPGFNWIPKEMYRATSEFGKDPGFFRLSRLPIPKTAPVISKQPVPRQRWSRFLDSVPTGMEQGSGPTFRTNFPFEVEQVSESAIKPTSHSRRQQFTINDFVEIIKKNTELVRSLQDITPNFTLREIVTNLLNKGDPQITAMYRHLQNT